MSQPTLTPAAFAAKWRGVTTTEKASAQSHFIDLCRMLGEPTPHEADPTGQSYAFEKRVTKAGGGEGFADVWKRDFFAWEYKGHRADLKAAYRQLLDYKDDLGNPPLFVVSDLDKIEIRTNFTGLSPALKSVTLDDLAADDPSDALQLLRDIFVAPEEFRPRIEPAQITEKAARHFAEIAQSLRSRGHDSEKVAHFLDRILFCLFAEDAGLLPKFRYTPSICFETFPFPNPTPAQRALVGVRAQRLIALRDGSLNPPTLSASDLAKRTLTNLYNESPTWLRDAHAALDAAVLDANGWDVGLSGGELLASLLQLNLTRPSST